MEGRCCCLKSVALSSIGLGQESCLLPMTKVLNEIWDLSALEEKLQTPANTIDPTSYAQVGAKLAPDTCSTSNNMLTSYLQDTDPRSPYSWREKLSSSSSSSLTLRNSENGPRGLTMSPPAPQ